VTILDRTALSAVWTVRPQEPRGPVPRRRARSLEAGLLRLRAAHARTRPHAGKWGGGGSLSLPCDAPYARVSRAGAHMRMDGDGAPRRRARRVPHAPACSCARGNERRRGWLAGCLDADLPHAACRRGSSGLGPWVCRRPASCGCGGGGSWLGGARGWLLGTGASAESEIRLAGVYRSTGALKSAVYTNRALSALCVHPGTCTWRLAPCVYIPVHAQGA
jgi:hypothetical protein